MPRIKSRYYEYAPLFHLLPAKLVERFGTPLLRAGPWPHLIGYGHHIDYVPADFAKRLSPAWASHIWRHLTPGSPENVTQLGDYLGGRSVATLSSWRAKAEER